MKISWADQLSVGNALIDSDHKNLIGVVNRMDDAIKNGSRVDLLVAFELLESSMQIHTENEERIAEAIGYRFIQDKLAQEQSMDEIRYMIHKLVTRFKGWPTNLQQMYSSYLAQWINEHITKINMPMKRALQAFPYESIPGMAEGVSLFKTSMVLPIGSYVEPSPPIW